MNTMGFLIKVRKLYLRIPPKMRIIVLVLGIAILAAAGIGIKNQVMSRGSEGGNDYLTGDGNKVIDNNDNADGTRNTDEAIPKEVIVVIDPGHGGEDLGAIMELFMKRI